MFILVDIPEPEKRVPEQQLFLGMQYNGLIYVSHMHAEFAH